MAKKKKKVPAWVGWLIGTAVVGGVIYFVTQSDDKTDEPDKDPEDQTPGSAQTSSLTMGMSRQSWARDAMLSRF